MAPHLMIYLVVIFLFMDCSYLASDNIASRMRHFTQKEFSCSPQPSPSSSKVQSEYSRQSGIYFNNKK